MNNTRKLIESFSIKDWYDLSLRKEEYSCYIDKSVEEQINHVKGELSELLMGVEKGDSENIAEEVNDIIFTTISLLQSLLKKGLIDDIDLKVSGLAQKKKIFERQPFLKKNIKIGSEEEDILFIKKKNQ